MKPLAIAIAVVGLVAPGCSRTAPVTRAAAAPPSSTISGLPVSMNVRQRSTAPIPGSVGELSLTADDITRGQVMVSVIRKGGSALLGPRSMKQGDSADFRFGETSYLLKLTTLNNRLVGEDFATFVISSPTAKVFAETQKIERLIAAVESMTDAVFVRNGSEHSAKDAAGHLRRKLNTVAGEVTASEFIDLVASKSTTTGRDYKIRFKDGRTVSAREFLRKELAKLDAAANQSVRK